MSVLAVTASFLAIFVAILVVILGKFIDVLIAPPTFKFLFKLSSSVKDLKKAGEALRAAKEDIDKKIADAERQFRTPTSKVEGWKKDVDNIMRDIGEVVNKYNRCGDKRFFSYISIYSDAMECAEYHQRVKDLCKEGSSITVAMESDSNDLFAPTYEVPGSLELKYEKALEFVKHDSSVNVIGIWGMSGVGKTTLLKKIYNSCVGTTDFQHVIWITASREHSNVSKLQSEIVEKLRLNENGNPQSQARSIYKYLRNKNFILFIDDLWKAVDLTEVGVPYTSDLTDVGVPDLTDVGVPDLTEVGVPDTQGRTQDSVKGWAISVNGGLKLGWAELQRWRGIVQRWGRIGVGCNPAEPTLGYALVDTSDLTEVIVPDTSDLTEVGVLDASSTNCRTRKVVFTTRQLYVCGNMEAKEIIEMKCLDHTQSLTLFKEKVGERVVQSHPLISELVEDVAKECRGLPLALITVGRAMSTKSNLDEWKIALDLMRKSQVHEVSGIRKNEMQQILKISYDFLTENVLKKCFLSISMWPEDSIIYQSEIIKCWMGLGIIENSGSMDAAYQLGVSYIGSLKAACLLEDVRDDDNLLRIPTVKMHDVLRDLAIWIASENKNKWITKARTRSPNLELKLSEVECISLMFEGITELPLGITDCPNLHTLVLPGNKLTCKPLSNSFEKFHCLKYLDLSENELDEFPKSVFALTELQYLDLSSNFIETIPEELKNLKKLKYLLLRENRIKSLPEGVFSELVDLLILDLFCVSENDCWTCSVLCEEALTCLQKKPVTLGITVRSEEELNKLMLLSDLNILELCIKDLKSKSFRFMSIMPSPHTNNIPNCLRGLSIARSHESLFQIDFDTDMTHTNLPSLNVRYLTFFDLSVKKMIWSDTYNAPKKLFANLTDVDFRKCSGLEDVTWVIHLPCLQRLVIQECNNMRIAINGNHEASRAFIFTSLKVLIIRKMPNLRMFSTYSLPFPQLLNLVVEDCRLLSKSEFKSTACPEIQINLWDSGIVGWNKLESVYSRLFQG